MCERGPGGVTAPTRSHCISKLVLTEPRQRCDGNSQSRGACWSASFTVSPTSRRVRRPQASLRSGEGDSLFSTEEVVSTWPLPCAPTGNRSQPTAAVSPCFCGFCADHIWDRLPPVATTGLHKGSIPCCLCWLRRLSRPSFPQVHYVSTNRSDFPFDFGLALTEEQGQQIPEVRRPSRTRRNGSGSGRSRSAPSSRTGCARHPATSRSRGRTEASTTPTPCRRRTRSSRRSSTCCSIERRSRSPTSRATTARTSTRTDRGRSPPAAATRHTPLVYLERVRYATGGPARSAVWRNSPSL
jgi:hypothetical protein